MTSKLECSFDIVQTIITIRLIIIFIINNGLEFFLADIPKIKSLFSFS